MHSRVHRQASGRFPRRCGALLLLLLLIGPLATVHPAPVAAQDGEPPAELSEIWSYEGSDFFENNPRVSDGIVLATSADSVVHAVDAETGEARWQTGTGYITKPYMQVAGGVLFTLTPDDTGLNAFEITPERAGERWSVELPGPLEALNTPVTEDGLIVALVDLGGSEAGDVLALSVEDGSEAWSVDVSEFIYGVGLLYADGVIVVGIDERLAGLDAATGDELWRIDIDPTAVMLTAGDNAIFGAVRDSDELFALDPATGDEIWNVSAPTEFNLPVTAGDGLFFVEHPLEVDGEQVRGILAVDAETGEERYTIASMIGEVTTGIAHDGLFYLAGNDTVGLDGALEVYSGDGTLIARTVINATGLGVDSDTGVIYVASSGDDGELLHAYQPVQRDEGENGDDTAASGDWPPDLAAMALTPWDLADAGLENYGHGYSEMASIDAFAAGIANARGAPAEEVRDLLEEAGFLRAYYAYFYSPADNEDVSQTIASYVFEFADEDGAADAWDYLEDESGLDDTEDIAGFDDYGDASEATLSSGEDAVTGDPFAQLDVSTQLGNLHAGITIIDGNNDEPDEDLAAELIGYAIEQVENGLDADQPALSNLVPRLSGDTVLAYYDAYALRDGEAIWFYGESPDVADAALDDADATGKISAYYVWKRFPLSDTDEDANVWTDQRLIAFADEDAADAWLADHRESVANSENFIDTAIEDADVADGGYVITARLANDDFFARGITYRSGSLVVMIELLGPVAPAEDALDALIDAQQACLDEDGCIEPIGIPAALADYVADAGDGASPDGEETPDAEDTPEAEETPEEEETEQADGGPVIYEGELYPFAVEYDANDWRLVPEDDPADDDEEWIQFQNDVSTVWMVATQEFAADELRDCVDHYRVELGWEDAWELEPLDELTEDDERAYASYTMVDVLFGLYGYLSVECRPIDRDTVLMITHFAGADAEGEVPEDEIAAVEELTDGIVIYDDAGQHGRDDISSATLPVVLSRGEAGASPLKALRQTALHPSQADGGARYR